jgi:hypothetical protein
MITHPNFVASACNLTGESTVGEREEQKPSVKSSVMELNQVKANSAGVC